MSLSLLIELRDGKRGDGFSGTDDPEAVVRRRLDAHPVDADVERFRDGFAHRLHVRCDPWRLRDDRRVERADGEAALAHQTTDPAHQLRAARSRIRGVIAWKVPTDIPEVRCTEERVHERVEKDVAI